ncbi:DUF2232 domain-containing protein [Desmospora profundinema]|uniref:Uncharacterized protein YybS (DUF2232 family) n=1 Tax=Desmospora profundinema TaxID=1571184 RepID=A0ABU1IKT6_9BACL|nr:DUF2232 domain-containing protein [Desmospora profundinema]MDR6225390.1 uncharacterized protein YybS (DUF2232 family) [Desmospora profundinema]
MSRFTDIRGGLIAIGLYLLLFLSLITPLGIVTLWFLPLPFFWFGAKNGWKPSLFPVAVCGILSSALGLAALGGLLFAAGIGLMMGEQYRKPGSTGTDVALGGWVATWVGALVLLLLVTWWWDGVGQVQSFWREQWESTQQMLESYGLGAAGMEEPPPLSLIIPVMLFMISLPFPLLNFAVGRRLLIRQGLPGKYLPPIRKWRLPRPFFYFYFVALLLLLLFGLDGGAVSLFAGTAVTWMFLIFFIQGLSFFAFLLHRWNWKSGWVFLIGGVAFLIPLLSVVVHLFGILDTGTEWRKRLEKND